jgi:DNA-binding transcriptional ArsR family regulator
MSETRQWREAAAQLRLLGHPVRLALLDKLSKAPKCVTDIQDLLEVRQANVSQHLSVLRQAKIVDYHEDGNHRCYYILRPGLVRDLMRFLGKDHPAKPQSAEQVRRAGRNRGTEIARRLSKQASAD